MAQSIPFETFAKLLYEEAIAKFSTEDLAEIIRKENISCNGKKIEWEVFYLWMFILTYTFQRTYHYLGNEKTKKVLDAIHKHIFISKEHPELSKEELMDVQNIMRIRYSQYYKAVRNDLGMIEKGTEALIFYDTSLAFVNNLIRGEINAFSEFRQFRLEFGFTFYYLLVGLLDFWQEIKSKYEIRF